MRSLPLENTRKAHFIRDTPAKHPLAPLGGHGRGSILFINCQMATEEAGVLVVLRTAPSPIIELMTAYDT